MNHVDDTSTDARWALNEQLTFSTKGRYRHKANIGDHADGATIASKTKSYLWAPLRRPPTWS